MAPYLSLDITEAFDLVGALAGFLQLTNPSDWGEWYSHKAKLNDLESTTLDAVAGLDAEIAEMYVHDYLVGVAAEDSHDRSDEWLKATWDQITSADIYEAMESDLQAVQAAQRGAEGAGDGYVWLENMGNVEYDENDTHNPNEELEDVYARSGVASKLHTATTDEYLDRSNWLTWKSDVVDALHFGFPKMMYGRMFGADPGHRLGFDIADQQKELDKWRSNQQKRKDLAAEFGSRQVPPF